jgi:NAD(P)H-dependent flavin oxidoreductase YrpB (nitropropane dioxygenase family)
MGSPGFVFLALPFHPMPNLHTPLCNLLGCRYPVTQAPMAGGLTTPEPVAAVSEAGGFGATADHVTQAAAVLDRLARLRWSR